MLKRAVVGVKLRRVCLKTSLCLRAVKSHEFGKFAHIASCREALKQTALRGDLYVKRAVVGIKLGRVCLKHLPLPGGQKTCDSTLAPTLTQTPFIFIFLYNMHVLKWLNIK